ncbi:MAG: SDR family NAD(P)-dependent oxidoreductase [Actinomycetota bacterium]|nr:SDR family NAD(P)-dependent oxidoreductase [Actinomycetota bacterium]
MSLDPLTINGAVAVVTGGAGGIGQGIVRALLEEGATVIIADVEEPAIETAVIRMAGLGVVEGVRCDVSDFESVESLANHVFSTHGRCNLLFNNAGVGAGGGGRAWDHEPNDWKWCFGVNVFGTANGVMAFVPRMIESDQPGQVVNTSSGDGGFAPVPMASVYASSKAAVSCLTEALHHQLVADATRLGASVFYPSGGLMNTGLFNSHRNRPPELNRVLKPARRTSMTFDELKARLEASGRDVAVADLDDLGRFVVAAVAERRYVIARDLDDTVDLLHRRAEAISRFEVPPHHDMGI